MNNQDLDKLMALEVMGWKLEDCDPPMAYQFDEPVSYWTSYDADGNQTNGENYKKYFHQWHPTTDLNQAMQCVEKFGRYWSISRGYVRKDFWCVNVDDKFVSSDESDSIPLAICQAIAEAINE